MGVTQFRGYPTVDDVDEPDGQAQINALAEAVDNDIAGLVSGMRLAAELHYTSSGTFQKGNYAGIKAVTVEVMGGGGGSGFAAATSGAQVSWGDGGAGGAYAASTLILAASLASSETVTVGAGGIAGVSGGQTGGTGGSSAFGAHLTAAGGVGGGPALVSTASFGSTSRGSGGAPGGSAMAIGMHGEGDGGTSALNGGLEDGTGIEGAKGGGPYGVQQYNTFAISTGSITGQSAVAGRGIGSGSRGPVRGTSASSRDGAAGSAGRVIVRVYV